MKRGLMGLMLSGLISGQMNLSICAAQERLRYEYVHPVPEKSASERARARVNQIYPLGVVEFKNGVRIQAFSVSAENDVTGTIEHYPASASDQGFDFSISPDLAAQFNAYYFLELGWFLVPKNWTVFEYGFAPSGIASLLVSDATGERVMTAYDSSMVQGYALMGASLYFQQARKLAKENKFSYYDHANVPLKSAHLNANAVGFSYQLPSHNPSNGVAILHGLEMGGDYTYRNCIVAMPKDEIKLARAMLNFYLHEH